MTDHYVPTVRPRGKDREGFTIALPGHVEEEVAEVEVRECPECGHKAIVGFDENGAPVTTIPVDEWVVAGVTRITSIEVKNGAVEVTSPRVSPRG